jgi:hypothetical protein
MKVLQFMATVTRDDVRPKYGKCVSCGTGTRSHVLEPAEYEIIKQEVLVDESDVYSNDQWEEYEEVERYEMAIEAVVMCHRCWVSKQEVFASFIKDKFEEWKGDVISHSNSIKKAINTQVYYDYEDEKTIKALKILAKKIKEAALDG